MWRGGIPVKGIPGLVAGFQCHYVIAMVLRSWRSKPPLKWLPLVGVSGKRPVVNVLRLEGTIMASSRFRRGLNLAGLEPLIDRAFSAGRPAAVALAVNSPGGSPVQSALIAARIRTLADEKKLPVIAFAEDVAASGGYWLACAADEIYADHSSIIGSIGVIHAGFGLHGFLENHGIERRLHTAGDRKAMLDPFVPESEQDVKRLSSLLKELHVTFRNHVRERRGDRLKSSARTLFSGEFWTGDRALAMGLVDGIGDCRTVMRERFGDKVRFRTIARRQPLGGLVGRSIVSTDGLADDLVGAVEERLLWQRYGL